MQAMATRPAMNARDSSGRNISLLNEEEATPKPSMHRPPYLGREDTYDPARSISYVSRASSPSTPGLHRSDSYDSQNTYDPASPVTPSTYDFGLQSSYQKRAVYPDPSEYEQRSERHSMFDTYPAKRHSSGSLGRPAFAGRRSTSSYDEDLTTERVGTGKRYPCRYKDSHNCDKTFTTSGHASRHSKIHTAEKAVHCEFPGCQKKFTRADNMKQHLETHFKGTRTSGTPHKIPSSKLTVPAGVRKTASVIGSRTSRPSSRTESRRPEMHTFTSAPDLPTYAQPGYSPSASPKSVYDALDMGILQQGLPSRSPPPSTRSQSGLDALAAAVEQSR